ncbi:hypothetical protein SLS63_008129 [Diaporthe eres]|uniref:Major facilitator superfamily transporter n=1 Tax=Diaporthe eres TaxID=83184 RepID=A0ABR1P3H2_DIAER
MENRNSLVAMAKRNSAYLVPMNIIDPRASWAGHHGQPGQPPAPAYPSTNIRRIEEDELSLTRAETNNSLKDDLEVEEKEDVVLGSTEIFDKDGNIRLVPTPTPDPKDPLNLSEWRKWLAVASMCFFGSISLAAEIAIAGLTPVFLLEYSGVDPASTLKHADLKGNPDPLAVIPPGVQPVSLAQVSLLATIPLLSNGFATYLLGPMIITFGILAPWISVNYTWRWVYYITSAIGIFAWFFLIAFVPESRRQRTKAELAGQQLWPVEPGESRTKLDYVAYGRRTKWDDIGFFQYGIPFELTGLSNLTQIVSTIAVFVIGGTLSDKVTMWISKRRGSREPEYQLINLITPIVFAIIGAIVFGYADQFHLHYMVLLLGQFFLMTSPLMAAPIINNYVIESYPQWAGAVLTNVSVLRIFTSFYFNTQVTTWISQLGPLKFMSYIAVALLVVSSGIPLLFVYGKRLRSLTSGKVKKTRKASSKWGD